jgi:hypothetical protein
VEAGGVILETVGEVEPAAAELGDTDRPLDSWSVIFAEPYVGSV